MLKLKCVPCGAEFDHPRTVNFVLAYGCSSCGSKELVRVKPPTKVRQARPVQVREYPASQSPEAAIDIGQHPQTNGSGPAPTVHGITPLTRKKYRRGEHPDRLPVPQARTLSILAALGRPATAKDVARKASHSAYIVSDAIGSSNPATRAQNDARTKIPCLLTLRYVRESLMIIGDEEAVGYEITEEGREALKRHLANWPLPPISAGPGSRKGKTKTSTPSPMSPGDSPLRQEEVVPDPLPTSA